ncbi:MAG: type IV pilus assembly protein PilM [Negativicutes bacterium]|nr:type IV pilus assembly protein PilM [Negativicutes bacterium]
MWNKPTFFWRRPASVLGLDIGTTSLKLAEVRLADPPVLKTYSIVDLPPHAVEDGRIMDEEAVGNVLRRAVAASGSTCRDVVVAATGRSLVVREISMPRMTPEELREALKWDLDKYVPYSADSCYFDFALLGPGQNDREVRILLVIALREQVDRLAGMLKAAGLRAAAIDIEALALHRTIQGVGNAILTDIGAKYTQIIVFQGGIPAVSRIIPVSGDRFTDVIASTLSLDSAEAERLKLRQAGLLRRADAENNQLDVHRQLLIVVNELAREIRRTGEYYQIQNKNASVEKVILSGGGACLDNLAPHLAQLLQTEVLIHDPLAGITFPPSFDRESLRLLGPRLAVALGLSMRGGE